MALNEYHRKRDFSKTKEPKGKAPSKKKAGWSYVIQKHDATRLHYDFRLELDGVLKSWAVPQGPCFDPSQKRLAVEVEDHPVEYGKFEGMIPAGEYGGGTVLLWDRGTWEPVGDPHAGLKAGKLKFTLDGEKLHGGWTLVRMRPRPGEKKNNWLLIKEKDDEARTLKEYDVLKDEPGSVASGRTIAEIAADPGKSWGKKGATDLSRPQAAKRKPRKTAVKRAPRSTRSKRSTAEKSDDRWPKEITPQLATLVTEAPEGDAWIHEIKLDGYRLLAFLRDGAVRLNTRNGIDWTRKFPEIADSLSKLDARNAILDGEVVALDEQGASTFQELQETLRDGTTSRLIYYAFDLLYSDGKDFRETPLLERKAKLAELVRSLDARNVQFSDHYEGDGKDLLKNCCRLGLEGIISKRSDGAYTSGRGVDWVKTKCEQREEFVIGGYTDSSATRRALAALLIGYFGSDGELRYAGKVGTGFTEKSGADLRERLVLKEQSTPPFADSVPGAGGAIVHWVKPVLVAQIQFTNWTRDGRLRHPVFQGLREDKPPRSVVRDRPLPVEVAVETQSTRRTSKPSRTNSRQPGSTSSRSKKTQRQTFALTRAEEKELEQVQFTHPEKVLFPSQGITKVELAEYYAAVAERMLPHLKDRPLSLLRCPEGEGSTCFYQKHVGKGAPAALPQVMIREKDKEEPYFYVNTMAALLSLVQMGVLEIHPWGSRRDDVEKPDRLIFDLDPDPSVAWPRVIEAAKELRDRLDDLKLESFVKTTGGKGVHLTVPIQRRLEWPEVKAFTRAVVESMAQDAPDRFTTNMSKATRKGKIFLDYLRNDRGATAVAPYSTRAKEGATVATPLRWDELTTQIRPDTFDVTNVPERIAKQKRDPWEEFFKVRQGITAAARKRVGS